MPLARRRARPSGPPVAAGSFVEGPVGAAGEGRPGRVRGGLGCTSSRRCRPRSEPPARAPGAADAGRSAAGASLRRTHGSSRGGQARSPAPARNRSRAPPVTWRPCGPRAAGGGAGAPGAGGGAPGGERAAGTPGNRCAQPHPVLAQGAPAPQRPRGPPPVGRLEGSPPAVCREKCAFLLGFQNFPNTSDLIPAGFLGSTLKQQEVFKITGFSFE